MSQRIFPSAALLTVLGLACFWPSKTAVGASVQSIESFLGLKSKWGQFADAKTAFKLEGRYSSISPKFLRFRNCDLKFQSALGVQFTKPSHRDKTIEVTGHLIRLGGQLLFVVERYHERPSDLDTARGKKRLIDGEKPGDWYELAEWLSARSAFYQDEELAKVAKESYQNGIDAERRRLPPKDPQALEKLAAKVARYKLSDLLRMELIHEAYQLRWEAGRKGAEKQLRELAGQMARDLPGSQIPLEPPEPELQKKYWESPLAVYREADAHGRRKLHRVFYSEIIQTSIERKAAPDGSDGYKIAEEIDKQLPERHALAESYREKELALKFSKVATMTQPEMLELSAQFEARMQSEKSLSTKKKWLAARREQLSKDGLAGLTRAAELYLELLKDEKTAADLLKGAYKLSPDSKEIIDKLNKLGYRLSGGKWLTTRERESLPEDPIQRSIRQGVVVVGMTRSQVRKTLGDPTSMARIASARHIIEVWIYRDADLWVGFERRRQKRGDESKVVGISPLAGD